MKVAAAILAAGASKRLGQPKQLVELGGELLLERAVRVACEAGCDPVIVVLGANAERIRQLCPMPGTEVLLNPAHETGMASSIHAAVSSLSAEIGGLLLLTCDQPAVTAHHLCKLRAAGEAQPVGSRYVGRIGVPAFFPVAHFGALLRLTGDQGARALLAAAPAIDLPEGELDIDTAEALALARQRFG